MWGFVIHPIGQALSRAGLKRVEDVSFTWATKPVLRILDRIDPLAKFAAKR
jgi:hypothetical protein